jgi:hypothetical protein
MRITCRLSFVIKFAIFLLIVGLAVGFYLANQLATTATTGRSGEGSATVGYARPSIPE